MLRRVAAAVTVGSLTVSVATLAMFLLPAKLASEIVPITAAWCILPLIWAGWAALAPSAWVPERLPVWGSILGAIAGLFAAFVLNAPLIFLDREFSIPARVGFVVLITGVYYLLWTIVRSLYTQLAPAPVRLASPQKLTQVQTPAPRAVEPELQAAHDVAQARDMLTDLRGALGTHPQIEAAVERLESALNELTARTGGLL